MQKKNMENRPPKELPTSVILSSLDSFTKLIVILNSLFNPLSLQLDNFSLIFFNDISLRLVLPFILSFL